MASMELETLAFNGGSFRVQEIARPRNRHCRLLKTAGGDEYFLEYVVSTGPYKIDVIHVMQLSPQQVADHRAGKLDPAALARELEEAAWARGTSRKEP